MANKDRSEYEKFLILSADGTKEVDIRLGVVSFVYFENIFSPYLTAKAIITNTGNTVVGKDDKFQSLYSGLPLRGGEKVTIKIAGNSESNKGLSFDDKGMHFYVASITNVIKSAGSEILTLNLVQREAITNLETQVGKMFPVSQTITDSVKDICKNYLKTEKKLTVDQTENPYGFIGNLKKPFTLIEWLASKSVSGSDSGGSGAGFLFYETYKGFNFRGLGNLVEQKPYEEEYEFAPDVVLNGDDGNFKVIEANVNRTQDLISKLERGVFSSDRYYINPLSFVPEIKRYTKDEYKDMTLLGSETIDFPIIEDSRVGDKPSRIFVGVMDIGTIGSETTTMGWNNDVERNSNPSKYQSQSVMRYNQLFNNIVEITIPLNTNLNAGNTVKVSFPRIDTEERKEADPETSGIYMIKSLTHLFDTSGSYTKLVLAKDTAGKK